LNSLIAIYGKNWTTFSNVLWTRITNPQGAVDDAQTYGAFENTQAWYIMFSSTGPHIQIKGGLRIETTDQGYKLYSPEFGVPQTYGIPYTDFLPIINFKYSPVEKMNFRLSYYRGTNKPGFLEMVPCEVVGEYYNTNGNYKLKHAVAENFDFRWEYFPQGLDQIMVGIFDKNIFNAIEQEFISSGTSQINYDLIPENIPNAVNYGMELDLVKFIGCWGIKGNYTYTHSHISTIVTAHFNDHAGHDSLGVLTDNRPLYGQSDNCGNLSLLYRNEKFGLHCQLALTYTGDRIYAVSPFAYNDQWEKGFWQMDA
jgi:outer membrane receptor protein involved in Fe transport